MRFGVVETSEGRRFCMVHGDVAYSERTPELLPGSIEEALAIDVSELRRRLEAADLDSLTPTPIDATTSLLAPVGEDVEVWAAGVTYERSLDARATEAAERSVYDRVYEAERPELFLKAVGRRVVGPGAHVGIRSDSTWNVPEPELVLLMNFRAEIVGYTLGNDLG